MEVLYPYLLHYKWLLKQKNIYELKCWNEFYMYVVDYLRTIYVYIYMYIHIHIYTRGVIYKLHDKQWGDIHMERP